MPVTHAIKIFQVATSKRETRSGETNHKFYPIQYIQNIIISNVVHLKDH